jgi:hypothetical protein
MERWTLALLERMAVLFTPRSTLMARRRAGMVVVAAGLVCLTLYAAALCWAGYRPSVLPPFRSVISNESSMDEHGFRLTLRNIRREHGVIRLAYALEHTQCREGDSPVYFRFPYLFMRVHLWDSDGFKMADIRLREVDSLSRGFRYGWLQLHEAVVTVEDHRAARYVAVSCGFLTTKRVFLPHASASRGVDP